LGVVRFGCARIAARRQLLLSAADPIVAAQAAEQGRGAALVGRMRAAGKRAGRPRLSTDEIMALTRGE